MNKDDVQTREDVPESVKGVTVPHSDEPETAAGSPGASGAMMDLLAQHVPLTLLADLAVVNPVSEEILETEGLPEQAWWEPGPQEATGPDDEAEPVPPEPAAAG